MAKYVRCQRSSKFSIFPFLVHEVDVEDHIEYLTMQGGGPSAISGFLEAFRFCFYVVGIDTAASPISVKAKRMAEMVDMSGQKKQARVLSVAEVE